MLSESIQEARRQLEICNACRYCEGYCSVFPAVHSRRAFDDVTVTHLANLCHNCRGCYYACQYTEPHEFALNLPAALANVRQQSWQDYTWPISLSRAFHRSGVAIVLATIAGLIVLMLAIHQLGSWQGEGFYGVLSHNAMVSIFLPAFLLPILVIAVSIRKYWRASHAGHTRGAAITETISSAATMNNLAGGHGEGCNFEDEDRYSNTRRWMHQATLYGFLLCFASTSVAILMHYFLNMPAPYPLFSLPKLFGVSGGLLLCAGTAGLAYLKLKADRNLGAASAWGGEMGFVLLLFVVSASGLALYGFGDTAALQALLVIHLGAVFAFFLLMPYTKMMHGFFRLAALLKDRNERLSRST
ncbi:MAG: tricarballylate utilization 4Fe-4S protein TcuB [Gammaproteobacteria bacterium]|nr:tricarballylate utilization 4Fe-4S protein TcuB [Gammaproteobacteria bacterium]